MSGQPPMRRMRHPLVLATITIAALLCAWWGEAALGIVPDLFLPSPGEVLAAFRLVMTQGYADATLQQHLAASLARIGGALVLAIVTAVPVGLAMGLYPTARGLLDPIIELYRPLPPLAYLPLIVIWCGIGEESKLVILWLAMFAPVALATRAGVQTVPPDRIRAAKALGATTPQILRHVVFPSALPDVLTGIRIGLGVGWSTLVAAELVAAQRGLGFMIESAAQALATDVVVVGIIMIAVIAVGLELLIRVAEVVLVPWKGKI
jgi:taurine transport system permease protein